MEGSFSASQSKGDNEEKEVFSANAMEEYLKAQAEKKGGAAKPAAASKPTRAGKDISESSDKYTDEDFESVSKS